MPYTRHGHWIGPRPAPEPRPTHVARCGGPNGCTDCARDARQVTRHRYATRTELIALLADGNGIDRAAVSAVVDGLADLGADVDMLVKITTREEV